LRNDPSRESSILSLLSVHTRKQTKEKSMKQLQNNFPMSSELMNVISSPAYALFSSVSSHNGLTLTTTTTTTTTSSVPI